MSVGILWIIVSGESAGRNSNEQIYVQYGRFWSIEQHNTLDHHQSSKHQIRGYGIDSFIAVLQFAICWIYDREAVLSQPAKSHRSAYKFCTQVIRQSFPLTSVEGRCVQITYIKTMSGDIVLRLWKPRYRVEWDRQTLDFNQGDGCYVQCENKSQYWVFLTLIPRM